MQVGWEKGNLAELCRILVKLPFLRPRRREEQIETDLRKIQSDSKLLSGFPWPLIFKPEITK
jgi:hypothetical protein